MQRTILLVISLVFCFCSSSCDSDCISMGSNEVKVSLGVGFVDEEILSAKQCVLEEISKWPTFDITITGDLRYEIQVLNVDVQGTAREKASLKRDVIVLFSAFKTSDTFTSSGVLEDLIQPDTYYYRSWTLERDSTSGEWEIISCGL